MTQYLIIKKEDQLSHSCETFSEIRSVIKVGDVAFGQIVTTIFTS